MISKDLPAHITKKSSLSLRLPSNFRPKNSQGCLFASTASVLAALAFCQGSWNPDTPYWGQWTPGLLFHVLFLQKPVTSWHSHGCCCPCRLGVCSPAGSLTDFPVSCPVLAAEWAQGLLIIAQAQTHRGSGIRLATFPALSWSLNGQGHSPHPRIHPQISPPLEAYLSSLFLPPAPSIASEREGVFTPV